MAQTITHSGGWYSGLNRCVSANSTPPGRARLLGRPSASDRAVCRTETVEGIPGPGDENYPIPPDYQEKAEWAFARLMYPPVSPWRGGFNFAGDWREGGTNW